jgi:hypothetical protein
MNSRVSYHATSECDALDSAERAVQSLGEDRCCGDREGFYFSVTSILT